MWARFHMVWRLCASVEVIASELLFHVPLYPCQPDASFEPSQLVTSPPNEAALRLSPTTIDI